MGEYVMSNGEYTFASEICQLRLRGVHRDRYGRTFANLDLLTPDGKAYLATDHGELSSGRFRASLAQQAAKRNSNNPEAYEAILLSAEIALRTDRDVVEKISPPEFVRVEDFIRQVPPSRPYIVGELIEAGGVYGCAAKPKIGKTLLLLQLALAVARGHEWLGRNVQPGRVLFLQLEDSERSLRRRLETMNSGSRWPNDLLLHVSPFRLVADNYEATVKACQGAFLIICDPIIQASEIRDWNSQHEVRAAYDLWRRLPRDVDAAV